MFEKGHKFGKGNKGAKLIEQTLRRAIAQEDGKRIREGVEKLLDMFAEGDLAAFQIVANRIDGMPKQSVEVSDVTDAKEMTKEAIIERLAQLGGTRPTAGDAGEEGSIRQPSSVH